MGGTGSGREGYIQQNCKYCNSNKHKVISDYYTDFAVCENCGKVTVVNWKK